MPLAKARPFEGSVAPWGFYEIDGAVLRVHIPDDVYAAEAALRIAWQLVTYRLGGFLAHGCGLQFGAHHVAAIGVSGAGKSTLAGLSTGHPAHAKLLSDEIVQLFPDGRCFGTPFRSNVENVGNPIGGKLSTLLLLDKGPDEHMTPVPGSEALPDLASNLYRSVAEEIVPRVLMMRLLTLVNTVGVHRLTFRKDPAVGTFLADWLTTHAR